MSKASIGRVVQYRLTSEDAAVINKRRDDAVDSQIASQSSGAVVHVGNRVEAGDVYPMVITRLWLDSKVNGQVMLDGNDLFWATSVDEGTEPGSYAWPVLA